ILPLTVFPLILDHVLLSSFSYSFFFFFNDTATTEIYTLSLHDALPIWARGSLLVASTSPSRRLALGARRFSRHGLPIGYAFRGRSEEHTSELQSLTNLVCRLLLEKKKKNNRHNQSERKTKRHRHRSTHT